jgi:hypothetical protein
MHPASLAVMAGLAFAAALTAAPAMAQNVRSFVSAASGLDSNPCTRAAPCRTFATAINNTNPEGEINTLDPGGYGPVTITKSISIVSGLGEAGVLVPSGGTGITITAGATDVIHLRGLAIEGANAGQVGIRFTSGKDLIIENCIIRRLTNDGIDFVPSAAARISVSDTRVAENGHAGIVIEPSGGANVRGVFSHVALSNNFGNTAASAGLSIIGTFATGTIQVVVTDSVADGNSNAGFSIESSAGQSAPILDLIRSVASNNGIGVRALELGTLRLSQSAVMENSTFGYAMSGSGSVVSYGDNNIDGNVGNNGSLGSVAKQ